MSFIQNFFTSRDNNANTQTYVGQKDRLWYNPDDSTIRVSDGSTPGGVPVTYTASSNIIVNAFTANYGTVYGNLVVNGNISPAAVGKIGGVTPGPGANISNTGLLTIDTTGLPLSFGDFTANKNVLTVVNNDENMILQTQGNAEIQLVGNIGFYKPDGLPPNVANRYFSATSDGQISILVPVVDPLHGAVNIIGSTSGNASPPVNTGVMLQLTGQSNIPSRFYNDGIGSFAAFVGRRINGSVTSPTPVQAGDEIIRISSTGYNGNSVSGAGSARIVFQALENFTVSNTGSNLSFWTSAIGSNTLTNIVTIDNANGLSATQINTSGNISAAKVTANYFGNGAALSSITGANVTGTVANATYATSAGSATIATTAGTVTTAAQPNITSVGNLTSLTVTGNTTSGNIITGGIASITGNTNVGNLGTSGLIVATGNVTGGNLTTAGIANIGTLAVTGNATVTGNISAGNLNITANGVITTPRIAFNDGGVRSVTGGTAQTLNFNADSMVLWYVPTGDTTVTLANYTSGSVIKLIVRMGATGRNIAMGVADANNSTTGTTTITGHGPGALYGANQAVILTYSCVDGTAANTYVQVSYV